MKFFKHKGRFATCYPINFREQTLHQLYLLFGESKDAVLLFDLVEVNRILLALRKGMGDFVPAHSLSLSLHTTKRPLYADKIVALGFYALERYTDLVRRQAC